MSRYTPKLNISNPDTMYGKEEILPDVDDDEIRHEISLRDK